VNKGETFMANVILGTIETDELFGTEVDDIINGLAGDDFITDDEAGNELIDGGEGRDVIEAGIGDDFVLGGLDDDQIFGEEGIDTLYGGDGLDTIEGGEGNDVVYGEEGDDLIDGEAGDDILLGQDGADTITGGLGSDFISGGGEADILNSHTKRTTSRIVEKDEFYLGDGIDTDTVNLFSNYMGGVMSTRPKTDTSKAIIFDFKNTDDTLNVLNATGYTVRSSGNFFGSAKADSVILRGNNTVAVIVDQTVTVGDLGLASITPAPAPVV
jgi:Ca2+-binding RTX toxin-like protein